MQNFNDLVEEVKSRIDIVDIISSYIKVSSSGNNHKALCPFHNERTPSFVINAQKQMYKCFGCGEGGDVINFVMKMENLDFVEAIKLLAEKCGIDINLFREKDANDVNKSQRLQEINTIAARYFFNTLFSKENSAYSYFTKRDVSEKYIKSFGLGYANNNWTDLTRYLSSKGYTNEELLESGLVIFSKNKTYVDRFVNRVMFPIFNVRGKVIGFGGRVLDDSLPKYLNSPETFIFNKRHNLYALNFARKYIEDTIIVVEGYMDVISLFQHGFKNVVATLGTALTKEHGAILNRYAKKIILSYDSDEAGVKATLRGINVLNDFDMDVKVLKLDKCKDPDEYIRKNGTDLFKNALDNSVSCVSFRIDILKNKYDMLKDEDRINFTKEVAKILKTIKSPIDCDYYINKLSQDVKISSESIKKEVYGNKYKFFEKKNNTMISEKIEIKKDGMQDAEFQIIKVFINFPQKRDFILSKLSIQDFFLPYSREILNYMIKSNEMDIITIDKLKKIDIHEDYIKKLESIDMNFDIDKSLEAIIKTLKKHSIKTQIENLLKQQIQLQDLKKDDKNINSSEVDNKLINIGIEIMKKQKRLNDII